MIDGAPEVVHLAVNPDIHLVQLPSPMPEAAHPAHALSTNVGCEYWAIAIPPIAHCFIADIDPALEQQVFYL